MSGPQPQFPPPQQPLTTELVPRNLKIHSLSEHEINSLASGASSINLTFFGVCFGALISFSIVLYSGGIDQTKHSMYVLLDFASGIFAAYFGCRGITDHLKAIKLIREIKQGTPKK